MSIQPYRFKLATSPQEIAAYFALRQSIFVEEQGLFPSSDLDELDALAYPIIALEGEINSWGGKEGKFFHQNALPNSPNLEVLGIVRIYQPEPGLWYGGRLGVHRDYRRAGRIGKGLIYKAVTTANTWGCRQFLATVQLQNVRFFQRLHWNSLEELTVCGLPHHLMEADLSYYPPGDEPRLLPVPVQEAC